MDFSLIAILGQMSTYPSLGVILVLIILVTIISGATDAPNAIATAVSTRCLTPGQALAGAAVFNFIGLMGMTYISTSVADTMFNMVDFSGDPHLALMALMAAMIASIFWGVLCWFLGIPASKSHSLIAGITGAAIALNGMGAVIFKEWAKVLIGMGFSLFGGFLFGWLLVRFIEKCFALCDRRRGNKVCTIFMDISAMALSFLHGAQDGQKFMSIALLGIVLSFGQSATGDVEFPLWLMILCSAAISLGTLIGGKRIIKSVAMDMVSLDKYQAVAVNTSASILLLVSNLVGLPVSTSHCSTSAIMGVGSARNPRDVKWDMAGNMVKAWVLTFPCCGLIGYVLALLFMMI